MALTPKELFGSAVTQTPNLRAFPEENGIAVGTLGNIAGAPTLPHLTPLTYAANEWLPWADVDTTKVDGLLWAPGVEGVTADATNELHIQVFKIGVVHHDDIPLPTSQTQATLTAALKTALTRQLGLVVQGVAGVS